MTITRTDWEKRNGHRAGVVWFTGLSGSGKTTLAVELEEMLFERNVRCRILDGDRLRSGLNQDLGFSEQDRLENIRRTSEAASLFVEAGFVVLAPLISPYEAGRQLARQRFESEDFIELYVRCSLFECERRDPKGMYQLARAGRIPEFTGISAPYEVPANPELTVDTERYQVRQCAHSVIEYLETENWIEPMRTHTEAEVKR
ncbi:adenylyl-sulfate kinase [Cohnella kolymensis]|uniref:adenylyl-sulfate kinase n=1 Tax=Cohnella kolymensis TaxID=1590652 RepID=UPI0006987B81|nr:adenylyl-sulfate kinase [Cohnella kolymensis]